ncbi:hypothetical protein B0O99DRAFT_631509 [Bisporella sp. PMI_857]|nr:hypothetical protein B0O99DRAFT_631509 [Bisporella sp. PMI_857]
MLVSIFTVLATGAIIASAIPTAASIEASSVVRAPQVLSIPSGITTSAIIPVKTCLGPNFTGGCITWNTVNAQCVTFGADVYDIYNDDVSSIDTGSSRTCAFFKNGGCSGSSYTTSYDNDLGDGGGEYNDVISSWRCN